MEEKKQSNWVDVGGLWKKFDDNGNVKSLSIQIDDDEYQRIKREDKSFKDKVKYVKNIMAFQNESDNDKAPHYRLVVHKDNIKDPMVSSEEPKAIDQL